MSSRNRVGGDLATHVPFSVKISSRWKQWSCGIAAALPAVPRRARPLLSGRAALSPAHRLYARESPAAAPRTQPCPINTTGLDLDKNQRTERAQRTNDPFSAPLFVTPGLLLQPCAGPARGAVL